MTDVVLLYVVALVNERRLRQDASLSVLFSLRFEKRWLRDAFRRCFSGDLEIIWARTYQVDVPGKLLVAQDDLVTAKFRALQSPERNPLTPFRKIYYQ